MTKGGKFLSYLKEPPAWFLVLWFIGTLGFISASILLVLFENGFGIWVYVIYGCAAISLAYSVCSFIRVIPKIKRCVLEWFRKRKYVAEFIDNYGLRTIFYALVSFVINTAYVVINGVTAICYFSVFYFCMTAYYLSLGILRGSILYCNRKIKIKYADDERSLESAKTNLYMGCGIALFVLEIALIFAVRQIVTDESHAETGMILAIAMAAYTFYKFTLAIVNIFRAKRFCDQAVQCLRNINLVDALVSMLTLEVTLIAATDTGKDMTVLNGITGGVVCLAAVVLGGVMILQSLKRRKEYKNAEQR